MCILDSSTIILLICLHASSILAAHIHDRIHTPCYIIYDNSLECLMSSTKSRTLHLDARFSTVPPGMSALDRALEAHRPQCRHGYCQNADSNACSPENNVIKVSCAITMRAG